MSPRRRKQPELQRLVSVTEVARLAGWTYRRMLAHLRRLDEELGGRLLVKTGSGSGARYALTLAALRKIHPAWFDHADVIQDLERTRAQVSHLSEKLQEVTEITELQSRAIGRLARG